MEVYLDNSATTKVFPEVADLVSKLMIEEYGNPSSMHKKGVMAERYLRQAKEYLAGILKVQDKEIFFTSCGTESDNLAIIGTAFANQRTGKHLVTTKIEHPAVLETMRFLEEQGFEVTYLPVDKNGRIVLSDLEKAMRKDTILVSVMHVNNEVGSLQPITEAGRLIHRMNPGCYFHVDAVQGFGKYRILPKRMQIDLLSVSGHKIHGPKGVGALYIGDKVKSNPILFGGGQQKGMRSGTENVPGAAGMALAASMLYRNLETDVNRLYALREYFVEKLAELPEVKVNGLGGNNTAPHIVSATFDGVRSEVLLHALEEKGIYISAGSACASNHPRPSETLKAMGFSGAQIESTVRFSLSVFTTQEETEYTLQILAETLPVLRRFRRR